MSRRRVPDTTPKFHVGQRVVVNFWAGGSVSGFTEKQCQRPGFVEMHKGRWMNSPELAEIRCVVRLDEPFCDVERWTLSEDILTKETQTP